MQGRPPPRFRQTLGQTLECKMKGKKNQQQELGGRSFKTKIKSPTDRRCSAVSLASPIFRDRARDFEATTLSG
jgi:hypothetical protein